MNKDWTVEKHDTLTRTGGRICGTLVTHLPSGRSMSWASRMGKRDAIQQTERFWKREAELDAFIAQREPAARRSAAGLQSGDEASHG